MPSLRYECYSQIGKISHFFINPKGESLVFVLKKKVRPSRYTLAKLSVLLLAGSVMYLGLYNIWFDLRSRHGWHIFYSILWVFTISTQPSFLKNCSGDSQFNSDKFSLVNPWLDFWEPASFSFLEWGEKFWVRELPLGEFFHDFSSFYKVWYLVLATWACALLALVCWGFLFPLLKMLVSKRYLKWA